MKNDDLHARAARGEADACLHLAKRLLRGRGESRNYEQAVYFLDIAARAGHPDALFQLGKCYLKGIGCLKDPAGGTSCLEQAANQGHASAALKLGQCFEIGCGAPANSELAAYWYRKAAALGSPDAPAALLRLS